MEDNIILISNYEGRFTINFMGAFPTNKWTNKKGGKIYLTPREAEWVELNLSHLLDKGKIYWEADGVQEINDDSVGKLSEDEKAEFFELNTNTAKAKVRRMKDIKIVNELIDYANENEIESKVLDYLVDKANALEGV